MLGSWKEETEKKWDGLMKDWQASERGFTTLGGGARVTLPTYRDGMVRLG
jgi:hypothetical protein